VGISLLGPLRVDGGHLLEPRDRIALSVLAVRRGLAVSPGLLADALWGDVPPSSWPKQVQICVSRLRKVLGSSAIETGPGGYRLVMAGDDVDIHRFERLIAWGRARRAAGNARLAATAYGRALSLWRGYPLEELDAWAPARNEAARLEELRRTAEEEFLEARLAAGEHAEAVGDAAVLVADEPCRERRWALLVLAEYRCGRQVEALRTLARARQALAEEAGITPGPDLARLEAAVRRQDDTLLHPDDR